MSETFQEQLARVEMMAEGHDTWDLSDNDTAALKAVLAERSDLLEALEETLAASAILMRVIASYDTSLIDETERFDGFGVRAKAAIAKAKGEV
jgi:hypothetical protein